MNGKTSYKAIMFNTSGMMQSGVVVAEPPYVACPINTMVVAYFDDKRSTNPSVHIRHGMTTLGMIEGIFLAVKRAQMGEFWHMINEVHHFSDAAHLKGITIQTYTRDDEQYEVPTELLDYLVPELEAYESK